MPRVIVPSGADEAPCDLDTCVDAVSAAGFDPADESSLLHAADWLARLGRNPVFLGDILVAELAARHRDDGEGSGYGPQAIVLSAPRGGAFLRANVWPAADDYITRASGAHSFAYGLPHDHNFDFLTYGYFGPGYASDYYEYDYAAVAGFTGEQAQLRFAERGVLEPGKLMHYRALHDVHCQLPPESLSISLNVLAASPAQEWLDQYAFDLADGTVSRILNPGAGETFLRMAVALGGDEAVDLAHRFGAAHPSDRMRLAAFESLAMAAADVAGEDGVWVRAEQSGSRMVIWEALERRRHLAIAG